MLRLIIFSGIILIKIRRLSGQWIIIYPWFTDIHSYSVTNRNDTQILQVYRERARNLPSNWTNTTI